MLPKQIKSVGALLTLLVYLGLSAEVKAECSRETWKDCIDKPWITGELETPIGDKWWPHPLWGVDDQAGSTNWYLQPDVVMRALSLASEGRIYVLGREYDTAMPLNDNYSFTMRVADAPTGPYGSNRIIWYDDFMATEVGHVGTQLDGLGHVAAQVSNDGEKRWYNGFTETQVVSRYSSGKIGVEKLHPIVARGILIDVAGAKGVERLQKGYEISMSDLEQALTNQRMGDFQFEAGDAVFFHTGWGTLWKKDNAQFSSGGPGIGMSVARWLSDEVQAGVWGSDTWATEVVPNPDPLCQFCVHNHMITRHGIVNQENMIFDDLLTDEVYTFTYFYSPNPVVGAAGSMGAPLAVK